MSRAMPAPGWVSLCASLTPGVEPGEPATPICGFDASPPAKVSLLRAADDAVMRAVLGGYAHCGRMVDGNLAGQTVHRVYVAWSPGTTRARLWATRCGVKTTGAAQSNTLVSDYSTFPADMVGASSMLGTEYYMGTGTVAVGVDTVHTGDSGAASPSTARGIAIPATPRAQLRLHEVQYAAGFCFEPVKWVTDIETL